MCIFYLHFCLFLLLLDLWYRNWLAVLVHLFKIFFFTFSIAPTACRRNLSGLDSFFLIKKNMYIFAFSYASLRETNYLDFQICWPIFVFKFKYSFYSIGQGKSSPTLYGSPISLEMEINYPYLHDWPHKYRSAGMWADRILGARTLLKLQA